MKKKIFETPFNSYQAEIQIGEGGSGKVVKVTDQGSNTFAIKYLSPSNISREKIKRFRNELSFCGKCDHSNIIKVVDWGYITISEQKCPFYVMPFYSSSLRQVMKKGIDPAQVLNIFSLILNGVEAAHLQEVFHRDLKPENILLGKSMHQLVIADFGIARFAEESLHTLIQTKPFSRLANFQYAAPEQRERGAHVDHRADIYALGLILNEMYTSKLAHGVGFKRISDVYSEETYLDELVDLMLKQNPSDRPNSIADIKRELIARKNSFVSMQKLSKLKRTVIPDTEVDDPLVSDPPKFVSVEWEKGTLIFKLSQKVNNMWIGCFEHPGPYRYEVGSGPKDFRILGYEARVVCREESAQKVIDYAKEYLEMANKNYKARVEREAKERKVREAEELQRQIEEQEKTRKINQRLRL